MLFQSVCVCALSFTPLYLSSSVVYTVVVVVRSGGGGDVLTLTVNELIV